MKPWLITSPQHPTDFWLDTFTLPQVFENPELISALADYSESHQGTTCREEQPVSRDKATHTESVLFLRIYSAADFYSTNKTLMRHPPAVGVEIILDPYLLNIFPQSLLPTGALIVVIAITGWILSGIIWNQLRSLSSGNKKAHVD